MQVYKLQLVLILKAFGAASIEACIFQIHLYQYITHKNTFPKRDLVFCSFNRSKDMAGKLKEVCRRKFI